MTQFDGVPPLGSNEPEQQAEKSSTFGSVVETMEGGSYAIDAAVLAVQAGAFALEAGATTLKAVAAGTAAVGDLVAGITDLG